MEYTKNNLNSYNIHTIKTDKFKTIRMEINFTKEVNKKDMQIYTFLADIISDSSKDYKRRKDISIRLEELYKANFFGSTNKVGNLFMVSFILEFIDPIYINDKNYLEEVLRFPFEVINNPNVKNHEFDLANFNIVKRRIKEEIESIKESGERLAVINALKNMDSTSPSSYRMIGDIESLESITPSSLYDAYLSLFKDFNCDIFIVGNFNKDEYIKIIKNTFKNKYIKTNKIKLLVNNKLKRKVLKVNEKSNFIQSTLVMIYNIKSLPKSIKDTAFHVFNYMIAAGGINSKLYQSLRVDNSLCYGVRSLYLKYDELLIILVSLDKNNVLKAERLINNSMKEHINGKFSDDELEMAKKNLIFSLKSELDNNVSILNNYVFNYLDDLPLLESRIELIKKVKKEDLLLCGNSLKLNTIYIQNSGDINERD